MIFKKFSSRSNRQSQSENWPDEANETQPQLQIHSEEEEELIELAKKDLAYFAPIYTTYFPRIFSYCLRRVGQTEQAEDLTSLIFTRALSSLTTYKRGSFAAWLFTIAHNTVLNYGRGKHPQASFEDINEEAEFQLLSKDNSEFILEKIILKEQEAQLLQLIGNLSDEQQEILALSIAGRMSAREIGLILGKSEGAVRMSLHRTIQQLKTNYQKGEIVEEYKGKVKRK